MGSRANKPQPDGDTPQGQEGRRLDFSVPVSETLPIAQEPAEDPNQPSQPTNEAPIQPPLSEETDEPSS